MIRLDFLGNKRIALAVLMAVTLALSFRAHAGGLTETVFHNDHRAAAGFYPVADDGATPSELAAMPLPQFFIYTYLKMCGNPAHNDQTIAMLQAQHLPEFPAAQAQLFLGHAGRHAAGHAFPIPYRGALGNVVLGLPTDIPMCEVFGRRMNQQAVEAAFISFVTAQATTGYEVKRRDYKTTALAGGYQGHTMAYTWDVAGNPEKILLVLSTNPSPNADFQAFVTTNYIHE